MNIGLLGGRVAAAEAQIALLRAELSQTFYSIT